MAMGIVRLKVGAGFPVLAPAGIRILAVLDGYAKRYGMELTVTSGSEQRGRAATDPHMTGEAMDVRITWMTANTIRDLRQYLLDGLGPLFTVLVEAPPDTAPPALSDIIYINPNATALHMHIQRKKGTVWPPTT